MQNTKKQTERKAKRNLKMPNISNDKTALSTEKNHKTDEKQRKKKEEENYKPYDIIIEAFQSIRA